MKEQLSRLIEQSGTEFDWKAYKYVSEHALEKTLSETNALFLDPFFNVSLHKNVFTQLRHLPDLFLVNLDQEWLCVRRSDDHFIIEGRAPLSQAQMSDLEIIYLDEVPKKLTTHEVLRVLFDAFPRVNGLLFLLAPFALIPAFYANLFNTRMIYNDASYTLIFITGCFSLLWFTEFFVKKWVKFKHIKVVDEKSIKVEKYLFSLLSFSRLPNNLVKARQIETNRRVVWDNLASLITDVAVFLVAYLAITAVLGFASLYLLLFYLAAASVLVWARYKNYKAYIEHESSQQEMLTERISVCGNAQQLRFYDFESSFSGFEQACQKIFHSDKRISHVNFHWDEIVRYTSFLSSFCLFLVMFYQSKIDIGVLAVLIALLVLNGRISAALTSGVSKAFQLLVSLFHLRKSLEPLLDSISDNGYARGLKIDTISTIDIKNVTVNVAEQPLLRDINLSLRRGESYAVVGGIGAGKSTLLKAIVTLHDDYRGSIIYNSLYDATTIDRHVFADSVVYLDMNSGFIKGSLFHNFYIRGVRSKDRIIQLVRSVFSNVNVDYEFLFKTDITDIPMSSGQRRKLMLYMSINEHKSLIILDEALINLSPEEILAIRKYIAKLAPQAILLIATHDRMISNMMPNVIKVENNTAALVKSSTVKVTVK
ncbi:ATP-binding cassette domain-containing protein [Marinomonas sp. A79]|uniref:ATP-binding cassette domain-containing protein n=1 Tax=Marinomonas vulgaris TaxID=2823372 RepID=A0ABS5HEG6_9GAMM|nr:ATP-binding cassette domain-containing protein [Marinomonas vulgaris]MBR7889803.1 ATP-binding cassette domain-containing protein [Marinomonas vulgaris]